MKVNNRWKVEVKNGVIGGEIRLEIKVESGLD